MALFWKSENVERKQKNQKSENRRINVALFCKTEKARKTEKNRKQKMLGENRKKIKKVKTD